MDKKKWRLLKLDRTVSWWYIWLGVDLSCMNRSVFWEFHRGLTSSLSFYFVFSRSVPFAPVWVQIETPLSSNDNLLGLDKNLSSYVYHFLDYLIRGNSEDLVRGKQRQKHVAHCLFCNNFLKPQIFFLLSFTLLCFNVSMLCIRLGRDWNYIMHKFGLSKPHYLLRISCKAWTSGGT